MKHAMHILLLVLATLAFSGCNTMKGVGQDVEEAGDAIEDSAEAVEDEL